MDYIGNKCPVCDKYFHADDDIVVCPECGTPHHRECYKSLGHCVNEDKHHLGYDYLSNTNNQEEADGDCSLVVCKTCGAKNAEGAFFCTKCGNHLHDINDNSTKGYNVNQNNTNQQTPPFGANPNVIMFDPLGGVKPDAPLDENVTVGEAAKYVKQNTPYFMTLFSNIRTFSKSRFNFCAAIFGGGYLLYRKMYKIGAIITTIQALIMIFETYLTQYIANNNAFTKMFEAYANYDLDATMMHFSNLSTYDSLIMLLYVFLSIGSLVLTIVIGACANRTYYKHCMKKISNIKSSVENPADIDSALTKSGGVNVGLAISLWVSYIILSYLPRFFY